MNDRVFFQTTCLSNGFQPVVPLRLGGTRADTRHPRQRQEGPWSIHTHATRFRAQLEGLTRGEIRDDFLLVMNGLKQSELTRRL